MLTTLVSYVHRLLAYIGVGLLWIVDFLNWVYDPFKDFTRLPITMDSEKLSQKASNFEQDLLTNFRFRDGKIFQYRIPLPVGSPLDLGDQALWHGVYTAMWAFKRASVPQDQVLDDVLTACLSGLADQQPGGILMRGIDDVGNYGTDTSNDQASGHLVGLYFAWKYGTLTHKQTATTLMYLWASSILQNNGALVNLDGTVTSYGALDNGWETDPLRFSLLLAIYMAAFEMTQNVTFFNAVVALNLKYGPMLPYAKVKLWSLDTVYDTHRAAIHLAILADITKSIVNPAYSSTSNYIYKKSIAGLKRLRNMVRKQGNIWVNALCAFGLGSIASDDRSLALKVLSEINEKEKEFNTGKVNSTNASIDKFTWAGEWVGYQPLPRWMTTAQDFFFQRNLYALDSGTEGSAPDSWYNGGDFLAAYWLCRFLSVIKNQD